MTAKPLTDMINALTRYANETTGQSDTTLSDAVRTLCDGYGGGGFTVDEIATKAQPSGVVDVTGIKMTDYGLNRFPLITRVQGTLAEQSNIDNAFSDNSGLISAFIIAPNPILAKHRTFGSCPNLAVAVLIASESFEGLNYFNGCPKLEKADLLVRRLRTNSFYKCVKCGILVLRNTVEICRLENIDVLSATPFKSGGTGGEIYIPKVLYDHLGDGSALDYKSASNWSTYDGYGTITWMQIEGSEYENYYADGTPIE